MARLVMWNLMTLDGFVAGPGGDIAWHEDVWGSELEKLSNDFCSEAGALIFGRVTYDLMAGHWPKAKGPVADTMNALPKFVFSRTLKSSDWTHTQVFGSDVPATVARLKGQAAKDVFLFGSAGLAASLMPNGLIDEFRIGITPHVLGGGTPLFTAGNRAKLKLLDATPLTSGVVIVRYEAAK